MAKDLVFKDLVEEYRGTQRPLVVVEIGTALGGTETHDGNGFRDGVAAPKGCNYKYEYTSDNQTWLAGKSPN